MKEKLLKKKSITALSLIFLVLKAFFVIEYSYYETAWNNISAMITMVVFTIVYQSAVLVLLYLTVDENETFLFLFLLLNPFTSIWFGAVFSVQLVLTAILGLCLKHVQNSPWQVVLNAVFCAAVFAFGIDSLYSILPFIVLFTFNNCKEKKGKWIACLGAVIGSAAGIGLYYLAGKTWANNLMQKLPQQSQAFVMNTSEFSMRHFYTELIIIVVLITVMLVATIFSIKRSNKKANLRGKQWMIEYLFYGIFGIVLLAVIGLLLNKTSAVSLVAFEYVSVLVLLERSGNRFAIEVKKVPQRAFGTNSALFIVLFTCYAATLIVFMSSKNGFYQNITNLLG